MSEDLITFEDAIKASEDCEVRNLILGNGSSIAFDAQKFTYKSLFEEAIFDGHEKVRDLFNKRDTTDFESVIRSIQDAIEVISIFDPKSALIEDLEREADALKEILITVISQIHPDSSDELTDEHIGSCITFLENFIPAKRDGAGKVFTTNYDILMYWAAMKDIDDAQTKLSFYDGFKKSGQPHLYWREADHTSFFYLHGALHFFENGPKLTKLDYKTGDRILVQVADCIRKSHYPIFVAEGNSSQKLKAIKRHDYLADAYDKLRMSCKNEDACFFIHGHSLDKNDIHILNALSQQDSKFKKLFVSVFLSDTNSDGSAEITAKQHALASLINARSNIQIHFYDAASAEIWG